MSIKTNLNSDFKTRVSKEYFSDVVVAQNYDKERFFSVWGKMFDKQEKDVVISNLPIDIKNIKALDIGAGSGRFTIELAKKGITVNSCDYSQPMLDIIKLKIKETELEKFISLSKQDITSLTFQDDQFDFICCIRITDNLDTRVNVEKAIMELIRVLKPEGTVVFDVINPISIAGLGPKKSSMLSLIETKKIILTIPGVKIKKYFGRRIVSQTAYEKCPVIFLKYLDVIDKILSKIFPLFCVRIYFILTKD